MLWYSDIHFHWKIERDAWHPRITWMKTVLNYLKSHNLTLTEAVSMSQNRPLWRLLAASGFHYPSWRPELTAQVDGWPVSITRQHGPCWRARISTSRVDGPSTRVVNSGSGNRALVVQARNDDDEVIYSGVHKSKQMVQYIFCYFFSKIINLQKTSCKYNACSKLCSQLFILHYLHHLVNQTIVHWQSYN